MKKVVSVEGLTGSIEEWNESLRRQIAENEKALLDVDIWRREADEVKKSALECFEVIGEVQEEITINPEDGSPCLRIGVPIADTVRSALRAQKKHIRRCIGHKYSHLIFLDILLSDPVCV